MADGHRDVKSLDELVEPDDRVLRFTPLGLSLGAKMSAADAALYQQELVSRADLVEAVPKGTRESFERLRSLHTYGLFCYDLYTVANDLTPLVLDQALRERFVAYYDGAIPLVDRQGVQDTLAASTFDEIHDALNKGGSHSRGGWRLRLPEGRQPISFRGSFPQLLDWARGEGLLRGQRNRLLEPLLVGMRNRSAHPSSYALFSPIDSARSISDLAEIINHVWGASTPGGRLYPAPIQREVLAIGWDSAGDRRVRFHVDLLEAPGIDKDWTYLLVRAVEAGEDLWEFDSRFEMTRFPSQLLWGPGSWDDAVSWYRAAKPQPDTVDHLDRFFMIRVHDGGVDLPRRPEVTAGLSAHQRSGTWHLIRADYPNDAFLHVRGPGGVPNPSCARDGFCSECGAEEVARGDWEEAIASLGHIRVEIPTAVRVPGRWPS